MTETIIQLLTWSDTGWTGPYQRKAGDKVTGKYVTAEGWGAEDWNFATSPQHLVNGKVYGYAQGDPSAKRVEAAKGVFNVVFFTQLPNGNVALVGAYVGARYVSDEDVGRRWKEMKQADAVATREQELKDAFGESEARAAAVKELRAQKAVRWIVSRKNVLVFPDIVPFDPPGLRPNDPYYLHKLAPDVQEVINGLLVGTASQPSDPALDAAGFPPDAGSTTEAKEGRKLRRSHLSRERNTKLARARRALNLSSDPSPFHTCEACDTTLVDEHGPYALRGFDVHHQVPLAEAGDSEVVTSIDDLCVLCVRCHRLAHRAELYTVPELRAFLKNPK
jgi:hypothetical protein